MNHTDLVLKCYKNRVYVKVGDKMRRVSGDTGGLYSPLQDCSGYTLLLNQTSVRNTIKAHPAKEWLLDAPNTTKSMNHTDLVLIVYCGSVYIATDKDKMRPVMDGLYSRTVLRGGEYRRLDELTNYMATLVTAHPAEEWLKDEPEPVNEIVAIGLMAWLWGV